MGLHAAAIGAAGGVRGHRRTPPSLASRPRGLAPGAGTQRNLHMMMSGGVSWSSSASSSCLSHRSARQLAIHPAGRRGGRAAVGRLAIAREGCDGGGPRGGMCRRRTWKESEAVTGRGQGVRSIGMMGGKDDVPFKLPNPDFLTGGGDDGPIGNQAEAIVKGNTAAVLERSLNPDGGAADLDYLQELIAIQSGGPKNIGRVRRRPIVRRGQPRNVDPSRRTRPGFEPWAGRTTGRVNNPTHERVETIRFLSVSVSSPLWRLVCRRKKPTAESLTRSRVCRTVLTRWFLRHAQHGVPAPAAGRDPVLRPGPD